MRRITIFCLLFLISLNLLSQFRNISYNKADDPNLKIIQIDFRENSTLIYFQYINNDSVTEICAGETFYVKDIVTLKRYNLINSLNLPICKKAHVFDRGNQTHNFILEFEKIPSSIGEFDIIENPENGFNFYSVNIDKTKSENNLLDIASFIDETPVKEYSITYKDGKPILSYKEKGLVIAVMLTYDNNYGRYYQANLLIQNFTGKEFNFNPGLISCKVLNKEKVFDLKVFSYNEYIRKVNNIQAWSSFAVAFSESLAASNAGYSSSQTQSRVSGYSNSYGSASGYVGNTYGSVYGSSSTYASAYGTSSTQSYNGAAAYAAQQNARANVAAYENQQYQIKQTLSEGYLKLNTITEGMEYIGYVNVSYRKADIIELLVPINGKTYLFRW